MSQSQNGAGADLRRAVDGAARQRCPNAPARWLLNVRTERAFQVACNRWSCSYCGPLKQQAAHLATEEGVRRALARGERVRFFTLTQDPSRPLDMPTLGAAWNRMRTALKAADLLKQYACVVETTEAGALHLHVLATGKYVPKQLLSNMAGDAGFGPIVNITALGGKKGLPTSGPKRAEAIDRMARYVSKYLAKPEQREALDVHVRERARPVRFSYGWGASLKWGRDELVRRWRAERGQEPPERHPDDEWVVIVRSRENDSLRVYRGREQVDADDVAALTLGLATESERLRLLFGQAPAGGDPLAALPPPQGPPAAAPRLFEVRRRHAWG